jgi:hypothetical protein
MPFTIDKFMGLQQNIDYPDLKSNYCHVLQNIDIDDPVGVMRVRDGSADKYDATSHANYPFSAIISAYEFRFDKASETRLIVNDNGTLKTMTDGGNPASLTLPTGATLESGFQNQYLGWKDHIIISTGNGATNYMLWYGYVDRQAANNEGLFGNVVEKLGYVFNKAQLICPNGMFSNVRSVVYAGGYYYFSFLNSLYIEKRDTNWQLVDRFDVHPDGFSQTATAGRDIILCKGYAGGDVIYAVGMYGVDSVVAWKINVNGWKLLFEYDSGALAGLDATSSLGGACADTAHLYIAITDDTDGVVLKVGVSDMVQDASDLINDILDIACDDTDSTGKYYIIEAGDVHAFAKATMTAVPDTDATPVDAQHCHYDDVADDLYVTDQNGDGHVYKYDGTNIAGGPTDYTNVDEPKALIFVTLTAMRAISSKYGTLEEIDSTDTDAPGLIGINHVSSEAGSLDAGTYFYKMSIIDIEGEEYTLSDPIFVGTSASNKNNLRLIAHTDYLNDLYRVKYINIYRAYSSISTDEEFPATDYKFLKQIDINSTVWTADSDHEIYYYDYTDNTTEDTISSVTYLENSGVGDTVKPRYINGKHIEYVGNKLHLGNFYHDGDNYPNRVIQSADDAPDALSFYNYYDYDVGDGEEIKGITSSFGRSVVFKNRKFRTFLDGVPERDFFPGISSESGYTKKNEDVYFGSDQGLHIFNGNKVINIHYPVITEFNAQASKSLLTVFYVEAKDRIIFSYRASRVLVWNIKYNIWTKYTSVMAFRGFFKNYENEYIGWNAVNFNILFNSTYVNDIEDYGGGNGTAIAIDYESPLLLGKEKGNISILETNKHRLFKGSETVTFTVYDYTLTGRSSVATQALAAPTSGTNAVAKTHFFNQVMGEAFQFRINGSITGGDFKYYGFTIDYREGGLLYR